MCCGNRKNNENIVQQKHVHIRSSAQITNALGLPQCKSIPDSKIHGASMGPTWVLLAPGGPHVGPMNLAIWDGIVGSGDTTVLL